MQITSKTLSDTAIAAKGYIQFLKEKLSTASAGTTKATIVGLYGELGSGKTTFSQSVAQTLGVSETVTSPTFVIEKIYKTLDTRFTQFIHIDAYRLEAGKELHVLDFKRLCDDPNNLIFIEWPEKVADILPPDIFKISFTFIDESTRGISYDSTHGSSKKISS